MNCIDNCIDKPGNHFEGSGILVNLEIKAHAVLHLSEVSYDRPKGQTTTKEKIWTHFGISCFTVVVASSGVFGLDHAIAV